MHLEVGRNSVFTSCIWEEYWRTPLRKKEDSISSSWAVTLSFREFPCSENGICCFLAVCVAQLVRYLCCSGSWYYSVSFFTLALFGCLVWFWVVVSRFRAEETVSADVCNDFIGLSERDDVGSAGYGFFGWGGQGLCLSLDCGVFLSASIETKNE